MPRSIGHLCMLCLAATLLFCLAVPSVACNGTKEIYADDFKERDFGWFIGAADIQTGNVSVGDGRMFVRSDPNKNRLILNAAFGLPADTDVCVKARFVESPDLSKSYVGLVFWATKGFDDNYVFQLTGNGMYAIAHWFDRSWQVITPFSSANAFKQGLNQDNTLRVVTKGQTVTLFVNDEQVAKFRAPVPAGTVKAGLRVGSTGSDPSGAEFRDFRVTDVP